MRGWSGLWLTAISDPAPRFPCVSDPLWERACSRKRSVSRHNYRLTDRFREQARSHIGFA
ncbi:hypothetical protein E5170_09540 [Pseudomonas atacamensis]|uniref:Uncharacterized protein n=1 Tax=Pseudomonas atacamensis TaxID=2565368 RepID=A0AAQ2I2K9_9PSED|nr:hypothetical protein E5170_09540 [Pseudomonas atacamensis]